MIIGHLPAGYIISSLLFPRAQWALQTTRRVFIAAGMAGALAPDLDMLYFHLVDQRQHHHHTYFTHYPSFWAALLLPSVLWLLATKGAGKAALASIFSLNGFIHLVLDTIVGDIWWLAPLPGPPYSFATVPALYQPWWLNFLLHWSFLLELALVAGGAALWLRNRKALRTSATPRPA
jgi:LexA-binding, inner membrane-associated putative hydrolase